MRPIAFASLLLSLAATPAGAAEYAGLYISGFEKSDFEVCSARAEGAAAKGAVLWMAAPDARAMIDAWRKGKGPGAYPYLWVELAGEIADGKRDLRREIVVTRIKSVRIATEKDFARCAR